MLELGDCLLWTNETYQKLGKLSKLRSLRLESGGQVPDPGLGEALSQLTRLASLELITYVISEELSQALPNMTQLRTLNVWPKTEMEPASMNTIVLNTLKEMTFLKDLDWGILTKRIANGEDAGDRSSSPRTDTIPFLSTATTESDEDAPQPIDHLEINELVERLCTSLPDTRIRVFKVPVS